jgi:hypothetical protein
MKYLPKKTNSTSPHSCGKGASVVAKVITPKGDIFFVRPLEELYNLPSYDTLPDLDKQYLSCRPIIGVRKGFTFESDFHEPIVVTVDNDCSDKSLPGVGARWVRENDRSVLVLPGGTKFEPKTTQEIEAELEAKKKPPLREK